MISPSNRAAARVALLSMLVHGCNSHAPTIDQRPRPVNATLNVGVEGGGLGGTVLPGSRILVSGTYQLEDPNPSLIRPTIIIEISRGSGKDAVIMASHSAKQVAEGDLVNFEYELPAPQIAGSYSIAAKSTRRDAITTLAVCDLTVASARSSRQ